MKNLNRNALLRDFTKATFCLTMAFVLLMMHAGCSEDTNKPTTAQEGGYTEETGIYANLENITISGKARRTTGSPNEGGESANFIGFEKGTLVTLYELDSVTFAKTDIVLHDTIDDESGSFWNILMAANVGKTQYFVTVSRRNSLFPKTLMPSPPLRTSATRTA